MSSLDVKTILQQFYLHMPRQRQRLWFLAFIHRIILQNIYGFVTGKFKNVVWYKFLRLVLQIFRNTRPSQLFSSSMNLMNKLNASN